MPAWENTSTAQSRLACGLTSSRPGKLLASERMAVPCTHATGPSAASPVASSPKTMAQAPSDDGQVSENRMGSQSIGASTTWSKVRSGWCKWA